MLNLLFFIIINQEHRQHSSYSDTNQKKLAFFIFSLQLSFIQHIGALEVKVCDEEHCWSKIIDEFVDAFVYSNHAYILPTTQKRVPIGKCVTLSFRFIVIKFTMIINIWISLIADLQFQMFCLSGRTERHLFPENVKIFYSGSFNGSKNVLSNYKELANASGDLSQTLLIHKQSEQNWQLLKELHKTQTHDAGIAFMIFFKPILRSLLSCIFILVL